MAPREWLFLALFQSGFDVPGDVPVRALRGAGYCFIAPLTWSLKLLLTSHPVVRSFRDGAPADGAVGQQVGLKAPDVPS